MTQLFHAMQVNLPQRVRCTLRLQCACASLSHCFVSVEEDGKIVKSDGLSAILTMLEHIVIM